MPCSCTYRTPASVTRGASVWEKAYRRRIKPGARPYVILRTMGPVEFVFDITDTEPINPYDDREPPPLAMRRVLKACAEAGIDIIIQDLATNLAGDVRRTPERATEFCLRLNLKHTEAQQFGTLAHELAHVFCGHLGLDRAAVSTEP